MNKICTYCLYLNRYDVNLMNSNGNKIHNLEPIEINK